MEKSSLAELSSGEISRTMAVSTTLGASALEAKRKATAKPKNKMRITKSFSELSAI